MSVQIKRWRTLSVATIIAMTGMLSVAFGQTALAANHVVQPGDTVANIAFEYGVAVDELIDANEIADPYVIHVGQDLYVPDGSGSGAAAGTGGGDVAYVVESGDSLPYIADLFGVGIGDLIDVNGLDSSGLIFPGDVLAIPVVGPASSGSSGFGGSVPYYTYAEVRSMLVDAAWSYGWDPYLIMSLGWWESGWDQQAVSWADAVGVMQLLPDTAAWAGPALVGREVDPYLSAWDNIETGVAYLTNLRNRTGSDYLALASYYQGMASVESDGIFPESRQYALGIIELRDSFATGALP